MAIRLGPLASTDSTSERTATWDKAGRKRKNNARCESQTTQHETSNQARRNPPTPDRNTRSTSPSRPAASGPERRVGFAFSSSPVTSPVGLRSRSARCRMARWLGPWELGPGSHNKYTTPTQQIHNNPIHNKHTTHKPRTDRPPGPPSGRASSCFIGPRGIFCPL